MDIDFDRADGVAAGGSGASITGALAVSLLAKFADYFLLWVQHKLTPKGLRLSPAKIARAT